VRGHGASAGFQPDAVTDANASSTSAPDGSARRGSGRSCRVHITSEADMRTAQMACEVTVMLGESTMPPR
jgi:hypothetical protein